jgi:hypothetical protein
LKIPRATKILRFIAYRWPFGSSTPPDGEDYHRSCDANGGAADRSGLIHPGDEVVEVNGIDALGKTPNDVLEILVSYRSIPIRFWLVRFR